MSEPRPNPQDFEKRILLVVIGMTPQIVTETLYKIAVTAESPFIPTEIHIITTEEGARKANEKLLASGGAEGWMERFKADFQLPEIHFAEDCIHVIADTEGAFIDDNDSSRHNAIASDFIIRKVFEYCNDPESAIHLSMAGGRKTMSFYSGYALSLYGRDQDTLSHVLVNPPFQNCDDFFYPRPGESTLLIGGAIHNIEDARIILSDIPFVRMRNYVPEELLRGEAGYVETIEKIEKFAQPPNLWLDCPNLTVYFNDFPVKLEPGEFAYYYWFCERCIDGEPPLNPADDDYILDFLRIYSLYTEKTGKHYLDVEKIARVKKLEKQKKWFETKSSALKKAISDQIGHRLATPFLIKYSKRKSAMGYHINLPSEAIELQH